MACRMQQRPPYESLYNRMHTCIAGLCVKTASNNKIKWYVPVHKSSDNSLHHLLSSSTAYSVYYMQFLNPIACHQHTESVYLASAIYRLAVVSYPNVH